MSDKPRIQDLPISDLLGGPSDPLLGHFRPAARSVETWLRSAGYHPGTSRTPATQLYAAYAAWCAQHAETLGHRPISIERWGAEMRKYLRAGRGKAGIFYYISQTPNAEVARELTGD